MSLPVMANHAPVYTNDDSIEAHILIEYDLPLHGEAIRGASRRQRIVLNDTADKRG